MKTYEVPQAQAKIVNITHCRPGLTSEYLVQKKRKKKSQQHGNWGRNICLNMIYTVAFLSDKLLYTLGRWCCIFSLDVITSLFLFSSSHIFCVIGFTNGSARLTFQHRFVCWKKILCGCHSKILLELDKVCWKWSVLNNVCIECKQTMFQ